MERVLTVIGDNYSITRFMPVRICPTFAASHSHRFNFSEQDTLTEDQEILLAARVLMRLMSFYIPAEKLRPLTPLKAQLSNETRCSSAFKMMQRLL